MVEGKRRSGRRWVELLEDIRYRTRRGMLQLMGPPQLGRRDDPLERLERERRETLKRRGEG